MQKVRWELLAAASLIGAAIFFKPTPTVQRYEMSPNGAFRLDTFTGEIVLCSLPGKCQLIGPTPEDEATLRDLDRVMATGQNSN